MGGKRPSSKKRELQVAPGEVTRSYHLEDQFGFILRQVVQRHVAIFAERFGSEVTPMQWAALAKLHECGACSQNRLGRMTAMDAATIKGVVERLKKRNLVLIESDSADARRLIVSLTDEGTTLVDNITPLAHAVTSETLAPLSAGEAERLIELLEKLR